MKIFSYGSLCIPSITIKAFELVFTIETSCFIKGYKIVVEKSERNPNYHFILCNETKNESDIVSGFILDVPDWIVDRIDKWEGASYERVEIIAYDRYYNEIMCNFYKKK